MIRALIYSILLILWLPSCTILRKTHITPEAEQYTRELLADTGLNARALNHFYIGITDLPENKAGLCNVYYKSIYFDQDTWDHSEPLERKGLIYHELGHCLCKLDDNVITLSDGCPGSLMSPSMAGYTCTTKHWEAWVYRMAQECAFGEK